MPSDFPRRPLLLKGALIAYEKPFLGPVPNVIVFQYNPSQLSRTLSSRTRRGGESNQQETFTVEGPPRETITATVELNAADQLADPEAHPHVVLHGLHPALAALELLIYPPSTQVLQNEALWLAGTSVVVEQNVPLVLFVWGPNRVLPVRLTDFSITEEAFDQQLNPIKATVDLSMRVMTYMELGMDNIGRWAYMATQVNKEVLARLNLLNSAEQIIGMLPF